MFHGQPVESKLLFRAQRVKHCQIPHLEEVFDLRVVVGFLLNQRGAVQLTRTESAHTQVWKKLQLAVEGESDTLMMSSD